MILEETWSCRRPLISIDQSSAELSHIFILISCITKARLPIFLCELRLLVPLRAGDFMPRNSRQSLNATRAAMYVRMSTEHQQYSTKNQADAIEKYAAQQNLTIVKRFVDSGKSGLTLSHRAALRDLLLEVQGGGAEFGVILVYDVSRWGDFRTRTKAPTTNMHANEQTSGCTIAQNNLKTTKAHSRRY